MNKMRIIALALLSVAFFVDSIFAQKTKKPAPLPKGKVSALEVRFLGSNSKTARFFLNLGADTFSVAITNVFDSALVRNIKDDGTLQRLVTKLGGKIVLAWDKAVRYKDTLVLNELKPKTDYLLWIFKRKGGAYFLEKRVEFYTLAEPPTRQSSQITVVSATDTSVKIKWLRGNGEGCIVVVSENQETDIPTDGKKYDYSQVFGETKARLGQSYVVAEVTDRRPELTIKGLKTKRYNVRVFEYNGEGKYRSYNYEKASNNPRTFSTKLPAPKVEVINVLENGCEIRWNKVAGAKTYILDLAFDEKFTKLHEMYKELDIGDLETFELSDLEPKTKFFLRLKARGEGIESNYSTPVSFSTK